MLADGETFAKQSDRRNFSAWKAFRHMSSCEISALIGALQAYSELMLANGAAGTKARQAVQRGIDRCLAPGQGSPID